MAALPAVSFTCEVSESVEKICTAESFRDGVCLLLPSGYVKIAMENPPIFNGKNHYFYGHFQLLFVGSPEGRSFRIAADVS